MSQEKYYIKLKCEEVFHFSEYRDLTVVGGRISIKIKQGGRYYPVNDRLSDTIKQQLGVEIRKNFLVIYKSMIHSTNIDFKVKTSQKRRTKKKSLVQLIGEFFLSHQRAPTTEEKQQMSVLL